MGLGEGLTVRNIGIGLIVGVVASAVVYAAFAASDPTAWRAMFPIHHGLAGIAMLAFGGWQRNGLILGTGAGLLVGDLSDFPFGLF